MENSNIPKQKSHWKKGLIIFFVILGAVILLAVGLKVFLGKTTEYEFSRPYIGELHIEGTISDTSSNNLLNDSSYDQKFLIERIDHMMNDRKNTGIILFLNTPGGSVYATDELYLKLLEYKKETGRPVYSYMGSMAASGGYYVSMAADKIVANRNCWTGSIGVTIGTFYDMSGLLDKIGVSTVTITAGVNKAMGSNVEPMTEEQKAIFQELVDEAYDQFVNIVATGRKMPLERVKTLADGRVYTAKQAKENGLIDGVMSFEDAVADMKKTYELGDSVVQDLVPQKEESFFNLLKGKFFGGTKSYNELESPYEQLKSLIDSNNKMTITYLSNIQK